MLEKELLANRSVVEFDFNPHHRLANSAWVCRIVVEDRLMVEAHGVQPPEFGEHLVSLFAALDAMQEACGVQPAEYLAKYCDRFEDLRSSEGVSTR